MKRSPLLKCVCVYVCVCVCAYEKTKVSRSPPTLLLTGGDAKDEKGSVVTLADAYEFDSEHNCWTRLDDDAAVPNSALIAP